MKLPQQHELDELLSRLAEGSISEEQQEQLAELLQDPEAQQRYLDYWDLHADLISIHDENALLPIVETTATPTSVAANADRGRAIGWPTTWLAMAVLATAVCLVVAVTWTNPTSAIDRPIGYITASERPVWTSERLNSGAEGLVPGPLKLTQGEAKVEMKSGATLLLRAPAELELIDAKALRLVQGSITVVAPQSAVGFRVITPNADIVDLGTEFNVSVEETGATEVHVSRGVVVARSEGSEAVVPILGGEAGRIDGEYSEIVSAKFDRSRFSSNKPPNPKVKGPRPKNWPTLPDGARIVFLGDRSTDQETHLLLLNQAFRTMPIAKRPQLFNLGITFPLWFAEADYQDMVVPLRPTHAVVAFGSEISMNPPKYLVKQPQFEAAITALCDRLDQDKIEPMIATGYVLHEKFSSFQSKLDGFNAFLRRIADERGYRVIDVERQFRKANGRLGDLITSNGRWPTFLGHQQMAKTMLIAWGYPELSIPNSLDVSVLPGVVPQWHYRHKTTATPLTEETVQSIQVDDAWSSLTVPQPNDKFAKRMANHTQSLIYRDRNRGFVTHLWKKDFQGVEAVAQVSSPSARTAYLNTGASVKSVWLNGKQVYQGDRWGGWHAGKGRVPIQLKAGENTLVVESGTSFFISITEQLDWPLP